MGEGRDQGRRGLHWNDTHEAGQGDLAGGPGGKQ